MSSSPSKFDSRERYIRTASGRVHKLGEGCEEFWHKGVQYLKVVQDPTINGGSEKTGIFTLYHPDTPVWSACPAGTWNEQLRERDSTALPPHWSKATVLNRFNNKSDYDCARGEGDEEEMASNVGRKSDKVDLAAMDSDEFDNWLNDGEEKRDEEVSDDQFDTWLNGKIPEHDEGAKEDEETGVPNQSVSDDDDPEWEQQWSVEHQKFQYYNTHTQVMQWDKPDAPFTPEYGWDPYVAGEM